MQDFQVSVTPVPSAVVVRLKGDASLTSVEKLREALQPIIDSRPGKVVLDLAELIFINSLGLGVILEFRRDLGTAGSKLRLSGAKQAIADIFRRTRLTDLFPMYETADAAVAE